MSKEDTAPAGLLSKMVKFVRNPATNWGDLDSAQSDKEEALSKQLLKEMIERKRRNDFVRKREFDMLRKLRKREAMVGVGQDPAGRPSFFQSSLPSRPDDRATTLKKIDEIEAQMSMQWWKTKSGQNAEQSTHSPINGKPDTTADPLHDHLAVPSDYIDVGDLPVHSAPQRRAPRPPPPTTTAFDTTELSPLPMSQGATPSPYSPPAPPAAPVRQPPSAAWQTVQTPPPGGLGHAAYDSAGGPSGFSSSKMVAMDVQEIAHDAELEEAAIRFANGDDAGAEAGLLEILAPGGARAIHPETWMTLFDLYRATGEQDKFESAALQFVEHFNRSAPQWFSLPDMVKSLGQPAARKASNGPSADWISPSVVGIQTLAALNAALARVPMPWRLDWSNLKSVEASAVEGLYRLFGSWAAQPVKLRFIGEKQLQTVLQNATPSGQRDVSQHWWLLRMEAMRVMHRPDDFELTALDFCVTYEVSPPAWDRARCEYKTLEPENEGSSAFAIIGEVFRDSNANSMHSSLNVEWDTQMDAPSSMMNNMYSVELSGQIQGDAIEVLDKLEHKLTGADMMQISCDKLIRVDFSAAGTLLNWVSAREAEHRTVQFSNVNRLVAAFFNVIGITEHARVAVRVD